MSVADQSTPPEEAEPEAHDGTLPAGHGVAVLIMTTIATNVMRLGSNLVITRFLAPEAFGIVGILLAINFTLTMITDMGFQTFVIRSRKGNSARFLNVIWTFALLRSVVLTGILFLFAGEFAQLFNKPELEWPIRSVCLIFLLEGLQSLFIVRAERARRVAFVSLLEFGVMALQTLITIAAAAILQNFWCIIVGMYARAAIMTAVSYMAFPGSSHRLAIDWEDARELWNFSRYVIVSSLITIALTQVDKVFIGRNMDLSTLGLYVLAGNLVIAARVFIGAYVGRILLPLYAEMVRTGATALQKTYYSSRRRVFLLLAFCIGGCIGGGTLIVQILLDQRYLGAGLFVSLLFLGPLGLLVTGPAEQAIIALGRIRSAVEANIVRLTWLAVSAPIGWYSAGMIGLVASFACIELAASVYWWMMLRRFELLCVREEALIMVVALIGVGVGFGFNVFVNSLMDIGYLPQL